MKRIMKWLCLLLASVAAFAMAGMRRRKLIERGGQGKWEDGRYFLACVYEEFRRACH